MDESLTYEEIEALLFALIEKDYNSVEPDGSSFDVLE
jgi:hypothetical protein